MTVDEAYVRKSRREGLLSQDEQSLRLRLATGGEVQARLRSHPDRARPKCLLLHGNPGSLLDWARLAPRLCTAADVAAIDLPGFGQSPRTDASPECMGLERLAESVIAAADALSWREPFYLVGHSHGGGVAQITAARYPERVAGLVLVGTLGFPAHLSYRLLALPGAQRVAQLFGVMFRRGSLRPLVRAVLRRVMRDIYHPEPVGSETLAREFASFSARPELLVSMVQVSLGSPCKRLLEAASQIRCPTLFVHGAQDVLVPIACARNIHARIGQSGGRAHFETLPSAGHMLVDFQADELAKLILSHMQHPSARSSAG